MSRPAIGSSSLLPAAQELDRHNVLRAFRRVAKAASLNSSEWTPRELRHSFISLLSYSAAHRPQPDEGPPSDQHRPTRPPEDADASLGCLPAVPGPATPVSSGRRQVFAALTRLQDCVDIGYPICSNSSTLDRARSDLHADDLDVKIRIRVRPTFVTTRGLVIPTIGHSPLLLRRRAAAWDCFTDGLPAS
jgi:hypothetical protein